METSPKVVPQFYNLLVIDGIVWVDGYETNSVGDRPVGV